MFDLILYIYFYSFRLKAFWITHYITEEEIKNQINPELYADELEVAEMVLEVEEISESVKKVRES